VEAELQSKLTRKVLFVRFDQVPPAPDAARLGVGPI
jgi:hypothetical protein